MNNLKNKLYQFMRGRYGNDQFNKFLYWVSLGMLVLSLIGGNILYIIALVLLVYSYFRMFSKNYQARYKENVLFMGYTKHIRSFIETQKLRFKVRKTHHIYRCPNCKQNIRVPRGKGKISITCPKCRQEFIKVS